MVIKSLICWNSLSICPLIASTYVHVILIHLVLVISECYILHYHTVLTGAPSHNTAILECIDMNVLKPNLASLCPCKMLWRQLIGYWIVWCALVTTKLENWLCLWRKPCIAKTRSFQFDIASFSSDRYVIVGCHYDAWLFGGIDPNSGTTILLELIKAFTNLTEKGKQDTLTYRTHFNMNFGQCINF